MKRIGDELNVRYALEGSVQPGGNRMRVNVELIDAETGNHLWAERFDKPLTDLFDMQDEIVARLANAPDAQLAAAEARRAEQAPNPDFTARSRGSEISLPTANAGRQTFYREMVKSMIYNFPIGGETRPWDPAGKETEATTACDI